MADQEIHLRCKISAEQNQGDGLQDCFVLDVLENDNQQIERQIQADRTLLVARKAVNDPWNY